MTDRHILTAVAWPYANGPRHIGHVSGFGVPSDVFSRFHRMSGDQVLMVSGTDEHGTPITVAADAEGITPRQIADRNNRVIVDDLASLGLSYDLFTRTTTANHRAVSQEIFLGLLKNGYVFPQTTLGAISPSTGRTLPDRYIEGTCPICGYDGARGDQCDNCGNQLDPIDLVNPVSRINGETPKFVEEEHYFLDLPAFTRALGDWLGTRGNWRPNVLNFSVNLLADLKPRSYTRDIDWGVPVPLDGWRDRPDKRIYVWFDAVVGYLSASIEWARRSGDPEAWRQWWQAPDSDAYYFMGKDNIVFHSEIWPAQLLGYNGAGDKGGTPGSYGRLNLPTEVVSSEFLTMEGRKFSSSRNVVIYVRDFLARYDADALRYFIAVAGPENQDTDFTWAEFLRRNNDELVAGWGNLVNRSVSMAAKNVGAVPTPGELTDADRALLATTSGAFAPIGDLLSRNRQKAAATEAMRVVTEANRYLSDQAPWKLKEDPARRDTVLHTALQAIKDCNALLTPFLPHSSQQVHELLGGTGVWSVAPQVVETEDLDDGSPYPIITGPYDQGQAVWASTPLPPPGTPLAPPKPVFTKLDPSIVEEELARLEEKGTSGTTDGEA
ncbi:MULTISPECIES: methionine--tRNA ligase [unclassified Modestobacter]|uniref:methionine--tRNA ligase n=1 Tax=unclassified Modestobacter TaxID=2643866 RepID=UPI0022AA7969|nr:MULTISPECIES: methionine--tRNA ligase [unclassified Modestobacter]MCZ2825191.1 methionine--tRNA ligase [Modestobacter sp. VKM Ac-2981]MCZ2853744.1 methionine--tRNA ligase [Modestobacter sp. VKM Ac-2982]